MVLGVGTRWSDFTTASRTRLRRPGRAVRQPQRRARRRLQARRPAARGRRPRRARGAARRPRRLVGGSRARASAPATLARRVGRDGRARLHASGHGPLPAQSEVIGAVNRVSGPRDVVVCAAGSMPGDLHKLWRTRDPKGYHVEYGYSCMGYEIAGGLGRQDGRPRPRGLRAGRRRLVPDDGPGARDRRAGGRQARSSSSSRTTGSRRSARCRSRWAPSASAPRYRGAQPARRARWTATSCPSTSPPTPRASARDVRRARDDRRARGGAARRRAPPTARPSSRSRPTRSSARRAPRPGGTSPSPRSRACESTRAARETYEQNKRAQRIHLTHPSQRK